jgi:hypothetical protein
MTTEKRYALSIRGKRLVTGYDKAEMDFLHWILDGDLRPVVVPIGEEIPLIIINVQSEQIH